MTSLAPTGAKPWAVRVTNADCNWKVQNRKTLGEKMQNDELLLISWFHILHPGHSDHSHNNFLLPFSPSFWTVFHSTLILVQLSIISILIKINTFLILLLIVYIRSVTVYYYSMLFPMCLILHFSLELMLILSLNLCFF